MASEFKISISDAQLSLLKQKLELTRLPDEIDDAGWDYGAPLGDIKRLVARWKNGYDWRKHERQLNDELPQFTRDIEVDGHGVLNIHYVYKRSEAKGAIPLFFAHGWPGSIIEVRKILPLLTAVEDGKPSFDVVAMSLPGYGFSEGTKKKGFDMPKYAEVGHKLMIALGYNEYVVQGGDWGYFITRTMSTIYGPQNHVKGWHTNCPIVAPPSDVDPSQYTDEEKAAVKRNEWFTTKGNGYFVEQSTQPQTIGYSLSDSPVGLLAWIYEKLVAWSDAYTWEDDEILTWISIYWFSRSGPAASVRTYYEVAQMQAAMQKAQVQAPKVTVPTGASFFPEEIMQVPLHWVAQEFNIVFHAKHDKGGHFAAYEVPDLLVGDLKKMFGKGGPAYGVVSGKDGY
ncbi:hypothetical protein AAF712_011107 [Marasmius tenuissimus]|uniref:Epoxide hydrolase N-terminal domain-containing protein n=1 Tax=Marasmius tenuissimus TaxID=585030 RepID=A0ABR2ZLF2_9AGAR|nr:hypothetical protein PM082_007387 [Marasmius tenuissimus]